LVFGTSLVNFLKMNVWDYMELSSTKDPEKTPEWYEANWHNINTFVDENGKMFRDHVVEREYIIYIPNTLNVDEPSTCLIYYHGLGESAIHAFFNATGWKDISNKNNCIVLYLDGEKTATDNRRGFDLKNSEIEYSCLENVINDLLKKYVRALGKTYVVGYSNGSMMTCKLVQKYGSKLFAAGCIVMGGLGKDSKEVQKIPNLTSKIPLLIVTGDEDPYKQGCEDAYQYFLSENFNVKLEVLKDTDHTYPINFEQQIWNFLIDH